MTIRPPDSPPPTKRAGSRRVWLPIALSALIAVWQLSFNTASIESRRPYAMTASMGLCQDAFLYFYFFHHFGVFPVGALEVPRLGPSRLDAEAFVARSGDRLRMDFGGPTNTARFGDYGKLFLFYPDLMLRGDPAHPSALPANELLFIVALLAVFWSFWLDGHGFLGGLIVLLMGSNPFQIIETYGRGNVFSIPISVALLALAVQVRAVAGQRGADALAWLIAIAAGTGLATVREIRAEAAVIGVSVAATLLLVRAPLLRRALLLLVFLAAYGITARMWSSHWSNGFDRAEAFVRRAGGTVFRPRQGTHHVFWHAIYCGLGDYGADRGFSWDDRAAFRWATTRDPVSNPDPLPYHYSGGYYLDETYDGVHRIAPTDLPEYSRLVRRRVLSEIRGDPGWYGRILFRRAVAIQRDATPASLSLGSFTIGVPYSGWLTLPVLLWALWRRRRLHAWLVLFMLPLSAAPLFVFSAKGMTFYGIAHLMALAVAVDLLVTPQRPSAHPTAPA